ncbi:MAG: hypothetical protein KDC10_04020 [Calditrichaeota bacterium]|nr:hypothetical protein [Candidatus Cloacimonadota bacterium]MCB1046347.1 hypothetical protein [Calditrichota bacterium]MCB9473390.1 hypothetical protein [Candidatus Delongbacteria bacterium]
MDSNGPGGSMVVRLIDVLFILLFGYLMIARFDVNAETDMPTLGDGKVSDNSRILALTLTVFGENDRFLYKLAVKNPDRPDLAGAIGLDPSGFSGEYSLEGLWAVYFNDPQLFDRTLDYRIHTVGDQQFLVKFQPKDRARTTDLFRMVDLCARYEMYAASPQPKLGEEPIPPRIGFDFSVESQ